MRIVGSAEERSAETVVEVEFGRDWRSVLRPRDRSIRPNLEAGETTKHRPMLNVRMATVSSRLMGHGFGIDLRFGAGFLALLARVRDWSVQSQRPSLGRARHQAQDAQDRKRVRTGRRSKPAA